MLKNLFKLGLVIIVVIVVCYIGFTWSQVRSG